MYLASVISEESEKGEMLFQYPGVAPHVLPIRAFVQKEGF